jgi:hypothetical protein
VSSTKSSWKTRARTPIAASIQPYSASRFGERALQRLASHAPSAIPPMKAASTNDCENAAAPRNSLR